MRSSHFATSNFRLATRRRHRFYRTTRASPVRWKKSQLSPDKSALRISFLAFTTRTYTFHATHTQLALVVTQRRSLRVKRLSGDETAAPVSPGLSRTHLFLQTRGRANSSYRGTNVEDRSQLDLGRDEWELRAIAIAITSRDARPRTARMCNGRGDQLAAHFSRQLPRVLAPTRTLRDRIDRVSHRDRSSPAAKSPLRVERTNERTNERMNERTNTPASEFHARLSRAVMPKRAHTGRICAGSNQYGGDGGGRLWARLLPGCYRNETRCAS